MEIKTLYKLITPYRCKICGQDMLFFTTPSGTIIDYKEFLNRGNTLSEMKTYLEKRNIKALKQSLEKQNEKLKAEKKKIIDIFSKRLDL